MYMYVVTDSIYMIHVASTVKLVLCKSPNHMMYLPTRGLRGSGESRNDQSRPSKCSLELSCSVIVNTSDVSNSHAM